MKLLSRALFIGLLFVATAAMLEAQATTPTDNDDLQSWNDLQLTVALNKKVDFSTALTLRFGKDISRLNDRRIAVGFIFKPTKYLSFQPFYWSIAARNSAGQFRNEHRLNLRAVIKFPVKVLGISHRSWFEYRIRSVGNTWRYRPSITIEKELPKKFVEGLKVFATEEPFYDSASGRFSRNRFSVGFNKTLNKKLSFDIYFLRQGDNFSRPGTVDIIGTALKIKM